MQESPFGIRPGDLVAVRRARWRVLQVRPFEDCRQLTLAALAGSHDSDRFFLEPFDDVTTTSRRRRVENRGGAGWRRWMRTALQKCCDGPSVVSAVHSGIDVLPYQLEPALALIRGDGCRVLLADAVGLGKTIQAGLIIAELRRRHAADRVLVLAPAGLRDQWAGELRRRFGIHAWVADTRTCLDRAAMLAVGQNPWATMATAVASIDYVKRAEVLPAVASCPWDVVVVDEAHTCTAETDRLAAVDALAGRAAWVVLLTATPHSGNRQAYVSLTNIGARGDPLLVFQRRRVDVARGNTRRVHRLRLRLSPAERLVHRRLAAFERAVLASGGNAADRRLGLSVLARRAASAMWSLSRSIERRLAVLDGEHPPSDRQLAFSFGPADDEVTSADEAPVWPRSLELADRTLERRLLGAVAEAAAAAQPVDSKVRALRRLLRRLGEPAIVFTEYRDTLLHVSHCLGLPATLLHGGLPREGRRQAIDAFTSGAVPLMLATDAGSEGLNLHDRCRVVVDLELPWNPIRLEQRIGRVDRIGQRRRVHAFHLIASHTVEEQVLASLHDRITSARRDSWLIDPLGDAHGDADPPTATGESRRPSEEARHDAEQIAVCRSLESGATCTGRHQPAAPFEANTIVLARTRHRTTRVRLGGRWLVLFHARGEDGRGQLVDERMFGLLIGWRKSGPVHWPDVLQHLADSPSLQRTLSDAVASWREAVTSRHRRFVAVRVARETSRAPAIQPDEPPLFQPGLYDRRAEHGWRDRAEAREQASRDSEARRRALKAASQLAFSEPAPVFVLRS